MRGWLSITATRKPFFTACIAAPSPPGPVPITSTSNEDSSMRSQGSGVRGQESGSKLAIQNQKSDILRRCPVVLAVRSTDEVIRLGVIRDLLGDRVELQGPPYSGRDIREVNNSCGEMAGSDIRIQVLLRAADIVQKIGVVSIQVRPTRFFRD